jgi:UMF1 family MFS transporter
MKSGEGIALTEPASLDSQGVSVVSDTGHIADLHGDGKLNRGGISWAVFEGGRDPYVILITIYIFMPYVAAVLVGDPVHGQEVISRWQQYAGWIVMVTAPFLGAAIDKLGGRKPWLGLMVSLMVPMIAALWWAKPGGAGLPLVAVMALSMLVNVLFTYSDVLHNSLLIRAAGLSAAHKASGLALALGNLFSVVALAFTAWAFALPGKVNWSWVPAVPLFGLNATTHEPERVVALLAAGLLALGSIPILLFTPDAPRTGIPILRAFRDGARDLWGMIRTVGYYKDAAVYLLSRMFFVDGMNAILIYIGVYAVGVLKWGPLELLVFGILISMVAVVGGFCGRWLDAGLGPKNALRLEISMTALAVFAMLGTSSTRILFLPYDPTVHAPLWDGPVFRTLPDVAFLLITCVNGIFVPAQYASSRTMLTRLAPPDQIGAFFGVYALSGVATGWLGPSLVNLGTSVTKSQQGGIASIVLLLGLGLIGLFFVKGGGRRIA